MRSFRTLRVSVTDRCDLDCVYCNAAKDPRRSPELSVDEIALLAEAAALAGARTVRLTGGEPLLRCDIEEIVRRVRAARGVREVALTTNAQRLAELGPSLKEAGLDRVNIGLPSLATETYRRMTGGELAPAMQGLEAALDTGLAPVKVNVVVVRGPGDLTNAHEIADFVQLARARPVEVRFIERMPFAGTDGLVPASRIREAVAEALTTDEALGEPQLSPTAEVHRPRGFAGRIGLISPVTAPFCGRCDRLRVTSGGRLRSCLSERGDILLRDVLSHASSRPAGVQALVKAFETAFERKPERHRASFRGSMRRTGG